MTTRLRLGLTDQERREHDQKRKTRNCLIALALLVVIFGFVQSL